LAHKFELSAKKLGYDSESSLHGTVYVCKGAEVIL